MRLQTLNKVWPKPVDLAPVEKPVEGNSGYRRVRVTFDTGAGDSVASRKAFPLSEVRKTPFSIAGGHYVAANGNTIDNEGEMIVQGKKMLNFNKEGLCSKQRR